MPRLSVKMEYRKYHLKWGGPGFYYKGDIATFSLRVKDTVTRIFHEADGLPCVGAGPQR